MTYDVIIFGAGAAGLMCACEAGKRGRSVLVLEHNEKAGEKIRISGGGRCNFTNISVRPENFISRNVNFCRSALVRYTPEDFVQLIECHGIKYNERKLGQLFCNGSSAQIVSMLLEECRSAHVEIRTGIEADTIEKEANFLVTVGGQILTSKSLVLATGGLSIQSSALRILDIVLHSSSVYPSLNHDQDLFLCAFPERSVRFVMI